MPAARADRCEATAAEPAGTGALPCPQQRDQHVQGPHRRAAVAGSAGPTSLAFRRPTSMPTSSRCSRSTPTLRIMQAPPANAQNSDTPFEDVVDLGTAIARAKGLDAATADAAAASAWAVLRRDQRQSEHGQRALEHVQGQPADGGRRDQKGRRKWAAIKQVGRGLRSRAERPRRQGGGRGRQSRSALQSLDRRAQRPDERARGPLPADPGDREGRCRIRSIR